MSVKTRSSKGWWNNQAKDIKHGLLIIGGSLVMVVVFVFVLMLIAPFLRSSAENATGAGIEFQEQYPDAPPAPSGLITVGTKLDDGVEITIQTDGGQEYRVLRQTDYLNDLPVIRITVYHPSFEQPFVDIDTTDPTMQTFARTLQIGEIYIQRQGAEWYVRFHYTWKVQN